MAVISVSMLLGTTVLALLAYITINILTFFIRLYRIGSAINKFPQDPKHWFFGHLKDWPGFNDKGLAFLRAKAARQPRCSAVWRTILMPSVTVRHPETVKLVLKRTDPKPTANGYYRYGKPWLGDGLLLSSGKRWSRDRKLLTPAFHLDILRPYLVVDNEACDVLLGKMEKYAESGQSMEIFFNMSLCTLDILLKCAFSYEDDIQSQGENHPYVQAVGRLTEIWVRRTTSLLGFFEPLWNLTKDAKEFYEKCDYVHSIAANVIKSRREALAVNGPRDHGLSQKKYMDFMDILLMAKDEKGQGLTDTEIGEQVDSFMFAGHDTTAASVTWVLYELAENPDIQEKCRQEVDEILGDREDDTIVWEDLGKFKYLTQCIKETQRHITIVPFVARELKEELTLDGVKLPAGTSVEVQLYTLHHNPTVWEDTMKFDPDRFLPENISKKDPYAFVPFSAGPRNCLGQNFSMQEQKVIIPRILRRFKVEIDPTYHLDKAVGIVTRPANPGLKLKILPRDK